MLDKKRQRGSYEGRSALSGGQGSGSLPRAAAIGFEAVTELTWPAVHRNSISE
jgi:hypothetical protein